MRNSGRYATILQGEVCMRMRKKPNMPRRIEKCGGIYIGNPEDYHGKWLETFPEYKELQLEIGCGRGRFTAETALTMPETLLVAIERVREAMIIGMERAAREGIPNIRFIDTDAAMLRFIFASGEVGRIYLNFCDPWPSNGHRKRRLTHEGFLDIYKDILRADGEIHFKTDNDGLFDYSLGQFLKCGFELEDVTRDLHGGGMVGIMTDYEMKFHEQGVSINRCVARIKT